MHVIVTRPAREAQDWVFSLRQAGWPAEALPLIEIAPAPDLDAVRRAWAQLHARPRHWLAVMFVSANAVEGFWAMRPTFGPPLAAMPIQAWATGPGTARALAAVGWPAAGIVAPAQDAPQFDSEALWARVAGQVVPGSRVLVVRGADGPDLRDSELPVPVRTSTQLASVGAGRDWFARQVREAGGQVDFLASYQRCSPRWGPRDLELASARMATQGGSVWLFSSSEAVRNLRSLLPDQDWGAARAIVTHERIARAARDAGFGAVAISRPALADVQNALTAFVGQEPR
ncbi:uroporphyrinogen-III synthase [Hylemonella gracilis]|uniref:Uroporphyrinogen-III synthase n=1 Tax=Hylemonella gracilis TaxID=80880 RepID=A0A4P6UIJ6_9BURK|nr:uroporphyrinogen-III synthase [Hylemonella gracilis]QBK04922.1 uroporphyrinogen-III synthase [Hylemonella gracilis]